MKSRADIAVDGHSEGMFVVEAGNPGKSSFAGKYWCENCCHAVT